MKAHYLYPFYLILIMACKGNSPEQNANFYNEERLEDDESAWNLPIDYDGEKKSSFFSTDRKKTHQLRDARTGLVVNTTEYPSNWKVISKPIYTIDQKLPSFLIQISGPNHLKSFNTPFQYHVNYQDPQMAQLMHNTAYGKLIRPLVSPQQIFNGEVKNRMANSGFDYLGTREQPDVLQYLRNRIASESKMQTNLSILNTEWKNNSGQKAMVSIAIIDLQQPTVSGNMMVWCYAVTYTFVDEGSYEETLEQMKASTFSYQENPQWQQYVAQLGQQRALENQRRAQIAATQHQNRMQARWAAFNAHQEKMKGIWAAQDANHASFMNRNFGAGSDTGQRQFINMINEEETVYNPQTGNNYQVNAGSTEYWMDSEGNYIQNDDLFYTPNGDINLNNREWTKVERAF